MAFTPKLSLAFLSSWVDWSLTILFFFTPPASLHHDRIIHKIHSLLFFHGDNLGCICPSTLFGTQGPVRALGLQRFGENASGSRNQTLYQPKQRI